MKKLLSILLTFVLALSVVAALPVHAEETAPFKVGEATFSTLADAYAALPEAGGTIELTANYESATDVGLTFAKPVTLKSTDGQKYTITVTAAPSPSSWWISASADLTIENVDVATTRGIQITGGDFLLKNSVFDMKYDYTSARDTRGEFAFIRLTGGSTATLSGTTVTYELNTNNANISVGAHIVYIYGNTKNTFTLTDNSSITSKSDTTNASANTMVMIDGADGNDATKGSKAEINVGEGCSLKNYMNMGSVAGIRPLNIIVARVNNQTVGADININLAKGSTLDIRSNIVSYNTLLPGWIMGYDDATHYTVNDNGCEYIVNSPEKKSNSGNIKDGCLMYFPTVADESGEKMFYATNAEPVANGGTMELTAGTVYTFKYGIPPAPLLENISGASIRTDNPYGIRFGATVDKDTYDALVAEGKTVKFGMIVTNNELLTLDSNFFDAYDALEAGVDYIKMDLITYEQLAEDGTYSLSTYIENDPTLAEAGKEALTTTLYACAYYEVTDAEGNTETVFSESSNARSIYDVAKTYKTNADNGVEGYEQLDFINNIVSVCEAEA